VLSRSILGLLLLVAAASAACDVSNRDVAPKPAPAGPVARASEKAPAEPRPVAKDRTPRVIFLGDSLTAGLGLDTDRSFPALIESRLKKAGYNYSVVNAGVSGDTSAGGLRRLEWALGEGDPKVLVVALGGNDGLRGLPATQLEDNLASIIEAAQRRGLVVILAGMEAPPNFGSEYTAAFRKTYQDLARKYKVPLIPFLLAGVAGDASLNQADGIHPNERGAQIVADTVWHALEPVLQEERPTR
jgi:acyl-CoA thioesterase-1